MATSTKLNSHTQPLVPSGRVSSGPSLLDSFDSQNTLYSPSQPSVPRESIVPRGLSSVQPQLAGNVSNGTGQQGRSRASSFTMSGGPLLLGPSVQVPSESLLLDSSSDTSRLLIQPSIPRKSIVLHSLSGIRPLLPGNVSKGTGQKRGRTSSQDSLTYSHDSEPI